MKGEGGKLPRFANLLVGARKTRWISTSSVKEMERVSSDLLGVEDWRWNMGYTEVTGVLGNRNQEAGEKQIRDKIAQLSSIFHAVAEYLAGLGH